MNKKNQNLGSVVYSTDPNFKITESEEEQITLIASAQKLRIWLETKNRGGKAATIITGFVGNQEDLKEVGKKIKNFCGTGGSVKDGEIIIQGDQRDKILQWLLKEGYTNSKKAG